MGASDNEITLTLFAGNATIGRMAITNATAAEMSKAAGSLLKDKLISYTADKIGWNATAVGLLSHTMAAYMVEVVRRTRMQVWVPPQMKTQVRVTTGTLSTSIVAEATPYVGKSGKNSKMSASIVITHSELRRYERSEALGGAAGADQPAPLFNTYEPVSEYTTDVLEAVFEDSPGLTGELDLQQIWLSMMKKGGSMERVVQALLDLPNFVTPPQSQSYFSRLTNSVQEATLALQAENEAIIQQSAINRIAYFKQLQAGEGAEEAMGDDAFIPF